MPAPPLPWALAPPAASDRQPGPAMTQSEAQPPLLRLVVTEGPQAGKELDSKKGTSLRVGRTAKSALYIKDPTISEAHAEVAWREGAWALRDLGSSNGTALNGRDLEEGAWAPLKDGDVLRLGTTTVARVEVAAVASDQLTVEQFVLAECAQLEQRIRCAQGGGGGCSGTAAGQREELCLPGCQAGERRQPPPAAAAQPAGGLPDGAAAAAMCAARFTPFKCIMPQQS